MPGLLASGFSDVHKLAPFVRLETGLALWEFSDNRLAPPPWCRLPIEQNGGIINRPCCRSFRAVA